MLPLVMFGLSVESLLENRAAQSVAGQQMEKEPPPQKKTSAQLICVFMLFNWRGGVVGVHEVILLHTQMS